MDGENRIPPALITAIVLFVLAVGAVGYYFGRFGGSHRRSPAASAEVPLSAAPSPEAVPEVPTPAEIPPTVMPPIPVVIEKNRRSSGVMVERSSQIVVPVPPAPTALVVPTPVVFPRVPTMQRRIVIEVRPTSTPAAPEPGPPPPLETPVPTPAGPPEEEAPEPEPEPEPQPTARSLISPARIEPRRGTSAEFDRQFPNRTAPPMGVRQISRPTEP